MAKGFKDKVAIIGMGCTQFGELWDKDVDDLNRQLHRELSSYMVERPTTITRCLHLMVISKCLERIADHATNIAEEVVYLYEARDIRHAGLKDIDEAKNSGG